MKLQIKDESLRSITYKILDVLIDYDADIKKYNNAVEDYNELGGIDEIAKIMNWDDSQKFKWLRRIENVNLIK